MIIIDLGDTLFSLIQIGSELFGLNLIKGEYNAEVFYYKVSPDSEFFFFLADPRTSLKLVYSNQSRRNFSLDSFRRSFE